MEINNDTKKNSELSSDSQKPGLWSVNFFSMLVTQFLGAFNDNMFRFLMIPIGIFSLQNHLFKLKEGLPCKNVIDIFFSNLAIHELSQKIFLFIGTELFLIPFVLMASSAGFLNDRFRKNQVIVGTKIAELVIMGLGVAALMSGNIIFLLVVLFFMGTQSTLFSPAKEGSIPEMVHSEQIPTANVLISMTTMVACILGMVCGGILFTATSVFNSGSIPTSDAPGQTNVWISACALLGTSLLGLIASLFIKPLKKGNPEIKFPFNPISGIISDLKFLHSWRAIWGVAFAYAFYWGIAVLLQLNIDKFTYPEFASMDNRSDFSLCNGLITVGVAVGTILAGAIMRGKISMKLSTFAVLGIMVCFIAVCFSPAASANGYMYALFFLTILGVFAGMYLIPLISFIQDKSPAEYRGRIIASSNLINNSAMLLTPVFFFIMTVFAGQDARSIWFWSGIACLPVFAILFFFVFLKQCAYWICWIYFHLRYKITIIGKENVPKDRTILYICNHVSFLDGLLGEMFWPGSPRILMLKEFTEGPFLHHLTVDLYKAIPISNGRQALYAIKEGREALKNGENVGIFPEGGISPWSVLQSFKPGVLKLLKGTDAVVVPVYFGGLWGSIFSYYGEKFFWKIPSFPRKRITIIFGKPIENVSNRFQLYQTIKIMENRWFEMEHEREIAQFNAAHPNCREDKQPI